MMRLFRRGPAPALPAGDTCDACAYEAEHPLDLDAMYAEQGDGPSNADLDAEWVRMLVDHGGEA